MMLSLNLLADSHIHFSTPTSRYYQIFRRRNLLLYILPRVISLDTIILQHTATSGDDNMTYNVRDY
jgi:hypothetical protein